MLSEKRRDLNLPHNQQKPLYKKISHIRRYLIPIKLLSNECCFSPAFVQFLGLLELSF